MIKTSIGEGLSLVSPKGKKTIGIEALIELHKIDMELYDVLKMTANTRDVAMNKKDGTTEIVELHQTRGDFVPKNRLLTPDYKEVLNKIFESKIPTITGPKDDIGDLLGIIHHTDLHFDRFEHKGKKYLQEIDGRTIQIVELLLKHGVKKLAYINYGDYFNSDGAKGGQSATTKGTPQNNYLSETESFAEGLEHQIRLIKTLASQISTDVIYMPGNHDHQKLQYLSDAVKLYFSKTDNVSVDNTEKDRKYYKRGNNTIGIAHGDGIKTKDIPQIMINETKLDKHNYFFKGHIHQRLINDLGSILAETFPSPAYPSAWESRQGFNTRGKLYAQIYDKKHGKFGEFIK